MDNAMTTWFGAERDMRPRDFIVLPQHRIRHGIGARHAVVDCVEGLSGTKVMIVTGRTIASKTAMAEELTESLGSKWAATFSECDQHVPRESVLAGIELARQRDVDLLISLGGGTPIDTAKGVAMGLAHGIESARDFDQYRLGYQYGSDGETNPLTDSQPIGHIALPTTISGGEYSHGFTIKNSATGRKDVYISEGYVPGVVILDPELTLATPQWLWSATGVRSIDHCIEGYLSNASHPVTSALAVSALPMLLESLRRSHRDPEDLGARLTSQVAAWMSIFQVIPNTRFGLSHGLGHQVGGRFDIPHGVTSCILLPHVLRFNAEEPRAAESQAHLAIHAGIVQPGTPVGDAASSLADAVGSVVADLELPARLRDYDVPRSEFARVAEDVLSDFIVQTNPRSIRGADDVIALLNAAW